MLFPQKINVIANTRHLNPQGEVVVTQNDTGVEFLVSVVGDGGQTKLPQDTAYVLTSLHLRKQPSQKIGTLQPDGNISFKLGAHELDQTGSVQAYVQAYHPLNGRVTSNPFIYHVASDPLSGAAIMPADKSLIETVIGDGPGIIQLAKEETQANITERARLTGAVGGALGSLEQDKTEALSTLEAAKAAAVEVTEVAAEKAGLAEEKAVFADAQGTFAKTEGEKAIAAAKLAADEAAAARLQKEEIAQTIAKGPVVSINGKTGPVTGIAEQAEVDEVNRKLADTAKKSEVQGLVTNKADIAYVDNKMNDISITQINKNKGLIDQTYLADALKQQIAGTAPINAVPADKSITSAKLADKAINHEKTNFLKVGKNLYNPTEVKLNTILSSSGTETENVSYDTTGYMPITFGKGLWISVNNGTPQTGYRIVLYDANYNKLETLSGFVNGSEITNTNARYFRTSVTKTNLANLFQVEFGTKITAYEGFINVLENFVRRSIGGNRDVETVRTLTHQADTRRVSVNRNAGRVTAIHEVDNGLTLRSTSIEYDATGKVKSFTQVANGVSIKSTINRVDGSISEITKEAL